VATVRFSGKYEYSSDEKGRINFKKFLNRLPETERTISNYHLLKQMLPSASQNDRKYPFFYLFTEAAWNRFYDMKEIDNMPTAKRMTFLAQCGEASLDSSERLTIPRDFLSFISNSRDLILQGDGDKIQVWNKADYEAYMAECAQADQSVWDVFSV